MFFMLLLFLLCCFVYNGLFFVFQYVDVFYDFVFFFVVRVFFEDFKVEFYELFFFFLVYFIVVQFVGWEDKDNFFVFFQNVGKVFED